MINREDSTDYIEEFGKDYAEPQSETALEVEKEVFGAPNGSNGYTTVKEADELAHHLALGTGMRLLDIGSGRGWPGNYLAEKTGCSSVSTDVPVNAVRESRLNAWQRTLSAWWATAAADGVSLCFRSGTFDSVVHTDVLC